MNCIKMVPKKTRKRMTMVANRSKNRAFLSVLCFFILLLTRSIINNRLAVEQIYTAINESRSTTYVVTVQVGNSSIVPIIERNRTFPISLSRPSSNSTPPPQCSRDEIRVGSWKPVILDAPPYVPRTVHLQCYPKSEYKTGPGHWMHTHEWQPTGSSTSDCSFSDWNRDDFCTLMRRATLLVRARSAAFAFFTPSFSYETLILF